jgi:cellulose synthase/poly-beta-1,6-N-acetylglucosamine synthase-like glycosyltransferase
MGGIRRPVAALRRLRVSDRLAPIVRRAVTVWQVRVRHGLVPFCRRSAAAWGVRVREWILATRRWSVRFWRVHVLDQLVPFCRRTAAAWRVRVHAWLTAARRRAATTWRVRVLEQLAPFCRRTAATWRVRGRAWLLATRLLAVRFWRVRVLEQLVPFARRLAAAWRVRVRAWLVAMGRVAAVASRRLRVSDSLVAISVRGATSLGVSVGAYFAMAGLGVASVNAAVTAVLLGAALLVAPLVDRDAPLAARADGAGNPASVDGRDGRRLCVCVPTYEEAENLQRFVTELLEVFEGADLDGTVLVIDDASPDGTGAIADDLAAGDPRIHVLHRAEKNGLGRAYQAGFAWALAHDFDLVAQMDCDFSHDPRSLPRLISATRRSGAAIGSRYVEGGTVLDWPLSRRFVSRAGSLYARTILRLPVRDATSGFKCFHREVLAAVDPGTADAKGYGFQIELTHRAATAGYSLREIPIAFRDRTAGRSKMTPSIAAEAALLVLRLWRRHTWPRARAWLRAHRVSLVVGSGTIGFAAIASAHPVGTIETLFALLFAFLTAVGIATLSWMLDAWRDGESLEATAFPAPRREPQLSFSLIVAARHEETVLGSTLRQLALQDYPDFEVLVVIGHDDPQTLRVAQRATRNDPRFRIVIDRHRDKSKPKALNSALPHCRGEIVGVFDAEDVVATRLLRAVDAAFDVSGADVVQGATQLVNQHSSWFSARNVLEYYFWFKSRLHFHSRAGFIPLGGNTVFVRRAWLERSEGWDESCLAEDCDLGARLSVQGARTAVAYTAGLATREETPETVGALIRQRTRWSQGFLQVLRKGDWRLLPWRARALALYTLSFPFVQAATGVLLPVTIVAAIVLHLPIELGLLSFVPLVPLIAILAVEVAGLDSLRAEFGLKVRVRDHLRLVVSAVPYQLLLSFAAARAAWREFRGVNDWEKTAHVGAHL